MFQFITISSGAAVWSRLVLDKVDPFLGSSEAPQEHVGRARGVAEEAAAAFCRTAFDPGMPSRREPRASIGSKPNGSC